MHLINYFLDFAAHLGHWGYAILFVVVMLECQALLGLFMPAESLVVISGFLAGQQVFELQIVIAIAAAGAIIGDTIGYELGKHFGRDWLLRHGHRVGLHERHLQKTELFMQRHGGKSVFFGHFMHFLRALMPFTAGAGRMPFHRFIPFNAAGCVLWAGIYTLLGYFFGHSWNILEKWIGRAGVLIGGLLLAIFAMVWLWQWVVRHEAELREQGRALLERPLVSAFRRRFAPQIQFLQNRLTPEGYLGLHLTVGALVVILAAWWFGGIAQELLAQEPLVSVDQRVAAWFNAHATESVTRAAVYITFLGSPAFLAVASAILAMVLLWLRSGYRLLALVLTMGGGALMNIALKYFFQRHRPVLEHPLVTLPSYSFPSGHTMGAALFYLFLALTLTVHINSWRWRLLAVLGAIFVTFLIGLTRIYLGAHYLSDIMGAMAAGLVWLAFCMTAVETLRRYRRQSGGPRN